MIFFDTNTFTQIQPYEEDDSVGPDVPRGTLNSPVQRGGDHDREAVHQHIASIKQGGATQQEALVQTTRSIIIIC